MVMRDRGDARFGDELGDGEAKWDVHRDGEGVLRDQHLDLEPSNELVE
jgi:hypothetical protein